MSLFGLGRNQRTFRPKKSAPSGSKGAQLRKHIDATLGSGNLREAVKLPTGEDLNEWLAVNSVGCTDQFMARRFCSLFDSAGFGCTDQFMARRFCGLFDSAGFGRHFGSFQDYMVE